MMTSSDNIGPPLTEIGVIGWLRKNLFNSWLNSILTIGLLWLLYSAVSQLIVWVFTTARWAVITANLRLFMTGPFPPEQVWRVWLVLVIVSAMLGLSAGGFGGTMRTFGAWYGGGLLTLIVVDAIAEGVTPLFDFLGSLATLGPNIFWISIPGILWLIVNFLIVILGFFIARGRSQWGRPIIIAWFVSFGITVFLLQGFGKDTLLPEIGTNRWGGLLLTFMCAVVSTVLSFPLGVLLALGRRSTLPAIKFFSIFYIEVVRGVPLVTVLFMAQIMLPLFLPGEIRIDNVSRVMAAFTLFTAAYMAENVRGGLQAIPSGQVEAAQALGLNNALTTFLIVLPQALRLVIPATVGLFISLFKDTTLATIVALLELLGVGRSVLAQAEFQGLTMEVYSFVSVIFFIFCYAMSYASYQVEKALGVGKR